MPEPRDLPLVRWGESLRRDRDERRTLRFRLILTASIAILITALFLTMIWPPRPALVWNASASSPIGLYRVEAPGELARGDMVVAWAPREARRLAAERHYLPSNVPLVKRVAAGPGDRVCAAGEAVFVNGELAARRREADLSGRPLPAWSGCFDLVQGQLLLLMPGEGSFDGRYFGLTSARDVVGRARLIWRG
jgi:conjugative transfer signal peptidase TraF